MRFDGVTPLLAVFRILPALLMGVDIGVGIDAEEKDC